MDQLYPIIRRVRRPLVVVDAPPVLVGNVEPVKVDATSTDVQAPAINPEPATQNAEPTDADTPY